MIDYHKSHTLSILIAYAIQHMKMNVSDGAAMCIYLPLKEKKPGFEICQMTLQKKTTNARRQRASESKASENQEKLEK